jgi:hypothetical protein
MEKGFLYVATGKDYLNEFETSCSSLKKHHPNANITLITDKPYVPNHHNVNIILKNEFAEQPYLYKITGIPLSPYQKTFFLDTDTYFCDSCTEVFELLDFFDLCIVPCNNDNSTVLNHEGKPVPGLHPYNTGVIAYRRNNRTKSLFSKWAKAYINHVSEYIHDQPPFMEALISTDIKILTLASIYNARTPYTCSFIGKAVKVIHGRHNNYEKLAQKLNSNKDYGRVWFPRFELVLAQKNTKLFDFYMSLSPAKKEKVKSILKPIIVKLGLMHYK